MFKMSIFSKFFAKKEESSIRDMDDSGYDGSGTTISKPCDTCRWWNPQTPTVCEAFPNGIPIAIMFGAVSHAYPYADEDLVYEPSLSLGIKKKLTKSEGSFEELHPRYPKGTPDGKGGKFMPEGSPEYIKAKQESLDRFKSKKYVVGRSAKDAKPDDYHVKSNSRKMREQHLLTRKALSTKAHIDEYAKVCNELEDDIANKRESFREVSHPDPTDPKKLIYTPERLAIHDKIIAELFANKDKCVPKEGEKPDFVIVGGVGGSGKSKFGEAGSAQVYKKDTHLLLDNDAIKEKLPGYNPEKAHLWHKEAGDILEEAMIQAKKAKLNIAYDCTLGGSEKTFIEDTKKEGYNVQVHYMHISVPEAVKRATLRWLNLDEHGKDQIDKETGKVKRGRLVPAYRILGMIHNLDHFDEARKVADTWSFSKNNVGHGEKPIKVISNKT